MNYEKFAYIVPVEDEGWELHIGTDEPNHYSVSVGYFHTVEDARAFAIKRGVPETRFENNYPGYE